MDPINCPHCRSHISKILAENIELVIDGGRQRSQRGFAYLCPECRAVLSVEMNPLTLKEDAVSEIGTLLER